MRVLYEFDKPVGNWIILEAACCGSYVIWRTIR